MQRYQWLAYTSFKLSHVLGIGLSGLLISACDGAERPSDNAASSSISNVLVSSESSAMLTHSSDSNASSSSEDANDESSSLYAHSSAASFSSVTLSGRVTFDFVPTNFMVSGNGAYFRYTNVYLDYFATEVRAARAVTVELLDIENHVLAHTKTDANGEFTFTVNDNSIAKVRVLAKMEADNYAIAVRDNTSGDALYILEHSLANNDGISNQAIELHADLGWNGSEYARERQSAPFAILDALHQSLTMVLDADPTITLPPLTVFWSESNTTEAGNITEGKIGDAFYDKINDSIYLLGHADVDTDEFDTSVIQHEFGHFIINKLSRDDNPGGEYLRGAPADLRTAFSEGFANAFASMSSNFPSYLETNGFRQGFGLGFNLEKHEYTYNQFGPANVAAIQMYLFDLFDDTEDDNRELGFGPILETLRSPEYKNFDGVTSIYSFKAALSYLMSQKPFDESRPYGEGESDARTLKPIYQFIQPGEAITENLWTDNVSVQGIDMEKYSNNWATRFVILTIPIEGEYTIKLERISGQNSTLSPTNPEVKLYRQGQLLAAYESESLDSEVISRKFDEGTYLLAIYDAFNIDGDPATGGRTYFSLTVSE